MPEHVHLLMFYYGGEKGLLAMDVGE